MLLSVYVSAAWGHVWALYPQISILCSLNKTGPDVAPISGPNPPRFNLMFHLSSAVEWRLMSCQPERNINFCVSASNATTLTNVPYVSVTNKVQRHTWTPARELQFPEALADLSLMEQKQLTQAKWCGGPGRLCFHCARASLQSPWRNTLMFFFINYTWSQLPKSNYTFLNLPISLSLSQEKT